jgi:transcriptional regulator with XRE-family HTH domain
MPQFTPSAFNVAFCASVKSLRERRGWTQKQMATALGVSLGNYQKYETRTPLPHRLIPAFCLIVGVSESELFGDVDHDQRSARPRSRPAA